MKIPQKKRTNCIAALTLKSSLTQKYQKIHKGMNNFATFPLSILAALKPHRSTKIIKALTQKDKSAM